MHRGEVLMQRVAITTLGCKLNQFESACIGESLASEGFTLVPFTASADIYVINSCTVTAKTDAESRRLVRRARRLNPAARIVVTGCYAQVASGELSSMPEVDLVVGNLEKKGLAELLRCPDISPVLVSDISKARQTEPLQLESFSEHTRAFLRVQNGCDARCSYCIVPHARGPSRSVPFREVIDGVRRFASQGYREVVLTGIHLGSYGMDLEPAGSLDQLIAAIEDEGKLPRLRIGSLEPTEVTDPLMDRLAVSNILCPHLHIPLQSGSDSVLQRMNRPYTPALFREIAERLVVVSPDISIGTDIIAGFPGETMEEFEAGYNFVSGLPLSYLHVFPFSARPGTPAAKFAGQLPALEIKRRGQLLRELGERKKEAFAQRFIGREVLALVQGDEREGRWQGLTRNYLEVGISGDGLSSNIEVPVLIKGVVGGVLQGVAV
jgi:threonylcarbamoyladenosine tRNA methylthiotransferase MtaB